MDTIDFIYSYSLQAPLINIISIDTKDMLNTTVVDASGTATVQETGEIVTGTATGMEHTSGVVRAPVVIRGYARTAEAAIAFYDSLARHDLPSTPELSGLEEYTLPNEVDKVHIFEITIGGVS